MLLSDARRGHNEGMGTDGPPSVLVMWVLFPEASRCMVRPSDPCNPPSSNKLYRSDQKAGDNAT